MPATGTRAPRNVASATTPEESTIAGRTRAIDPEQREQLVVPGAGCEIEQHRAGGVRDVGEVSDAVRELPDEPGVDRAEGELLLRQLGAPQDPLELRRREVRVGDEPRARAHQVGGQLGTALGRPAVLPDDGRVDRTSGSPLPHDGRLALVRDPEGQHVGRPDSRLGERLPRGLLDARPDLVRIVLHQARSREVLRDLPVAAPDRAQLVVDHQARRPGRALVDREDHARRTERVDVITALA